MKIILSLSPPPPLLPLVFLIVSTLTPLSYASSPVVPLYVRDAAERVDAVDNDALKLDCDRDCGGDPSSSPHRILVDLEEVSLAPLYFRGEGPLISIRGGTCDLGVVAELKRF